jgi:hypothetical protein
MENVLKNLELDFLSDQWVDLNQILNLNSGDQNKTDEGLNLRRPQWKRDL